MDLADAGDAGPGDDDVREKALPRAREDVAGQDDVLDERLAGPGDAKALKALTHPLEVAVEHLAVRLEAAELLAAAEVEPDVADHGRQHGERGRARPIVPGRDRAIDHEVSNRGRDNISDRVLQTGR